jgi:apolipoprotein N-acyltransferase
MPLTSSSAFPKDGRRMDRLASAALLMLAGAAQALSLAWPWARGQDDGPLSLIGGYGRPLWWLQILSLAVLARALQTAQRPAQAAGRAMVFACAWLVATFWWLFISMHVYGGLPAPLAVAAVLALAAFLGSYYAVAAWGWHRLRPAGAAGGALVFSSVWMLAEMARGWLWTGFPWGAGGYAHVEGPLSVLPRWIGVYGTGAVAAWLAYGLAASLGRQGRRPARLAAMAAALVLAWAGLWWLRDAAINAPSAERPALSVAMLQGNIPQDEKFEAGSGIPLALGWYGRELRAATAQLVVAPETAVPLLPQQLPEEYLDLLREPYLKKDGRQAALLGIPLGSEEAGYTNSVVGWQPGQIQDYQYDKHHLVPFGEFIPPLVHADDEHTAGRLQPRRAGPAFHGLGGRAAVAQHLLRGFVRRGAGRAFRQRGDSTDGAGELQQHRLVWRQRGHRPAPGDQPHACAGVRAPHAEGHQYRCHGRHRSPRCGHPCPGALPARRARSRCAGPGGHDTVCTLGPCVRSGAAVPGRACRLGGRLDPAPYKAADLSRRGFCGRVLMRPRGFVALWQRSPPIMRGCMVRRGPHPFRDRGGVDAAVDQVRQWPILFRMSN